MMAMSKGTVIFLIWVFMVCGLLARDANARFISYGAIRRGDAHSLNCKLHPENPICRPTQANKYRRGCENATHCQRHDDRLSYEDYLISVTAVVIWVMVI
ncbi:hypothetical protein I3760_04G191100 [Carya illinoinensis]|nr:hypothetical protein I3760_04G191100 [Carya illinoinensis]